MEGTMRGPDRGFVTIEAGLCKGCTLCVDACPPGVLAQDSALNGQGYYPVRYLGYGCTGCGICFYICPEPGAITTFRRREDPPARSSRGASNTGAEKPCVA